MNAESSPYSDSVRIRFRDLPGAGDVTSGGGATASGESIALERGAWVRFAARVESGRVVECRFRAFGCPHTLAAASLVACRLSNAPLAAALAIDAAVIARELDTPAGKMGRLLVVEDALRALLADVGRVQ